MSSKQTFRFAHRSPGHSGTINSLEEKIFFLLKPSTASMRQSMYRKLYSLLCVYLSCPHRSPIGLAEVVVWNWGTLRRFITGLSSSRPCFHICVCQGRAWSHCAQLGRFWDDLLLNQTSLQWLQLECQMVDSCNPDVYRVDVSASPPVIAPACPTELTRESPVIGPGMICMSAA